MENIWEAIDPNGLLSEVSRQAWEKIMRRKEYKKDEFFIMQDEVPTRMAFVSKGLFSKYFISGSGKLVISTFYPENNFMCFSLPYMEASPSRYAIIAVEDSVVWEYDPNEWETRLGEQLDVAIMSKKYVEKRFEIEQNHGSVIHCDSMGRIRYLHFLKDYPKIVSRLKDFEIAAYLHITVDRLREIRAELN